MDPLASLAALPDVVAANERARQACDELRWHEAYRRRWREVRAEAGLRSARASAALDGARVSLDAVRAMALGVDGRGVDGVTGGARADRQAADEHGAAADATRVLAAGSLRAAALVEQLMPDLPGRASSAGLPPLPQLVARVHAAAAVGLVGEPDLGRLRGDVAPRDLTGLGAAPGGQDVAARLDLLGRVIQRTAAPALVVAAVVHGELLALRPFVAANGVVARAVARLLLTARGLDPTGSVIAEGAWAAAPHPYVAAAAGFATGTGAGVAAWVVTCADAVVDGAARARGVADEVLAGRLGEA